ncbi:hypothetical protein Goshw_029005 [Gossypium schwendimanii]|uniref:Retrovirus-related Pol polyprotein from transposon TNT 1-94 n=1 Tax=Gossypium schwendimanii TaxID=34291 RepID=A0A7J9N8L2_GOSSC|nr:hypothetical protein [Gossypium schwendimanii]
MDASGALQENLEFARFEQQDCALASWLLSSVSTGVLPHLIGLDSSAQIWNAIVALYDSKTTSRLMSYRRALHFQRKRDLSMKDFLMKIKNYCDSLVSCGEIISDHEHVMAILNGLPPEYESVITIVTASQVVVCEAPSSANFVSSQAPTAVNETVSTPMYRHSSNTRGRGRGCSYGSRVQCQLCRKPGHLVDQCYHYFDASYKSIGYRPPLALQANLSMFGLGYSTSP